MNNNTLKRRVYETLISNKMFGEDLTTVVERLHKSFGGPTRNKIKEAIDSLSESGAIKISKTKGPKIIESVTKNKGTFIFVSKKDGGKIISENGQKEISVPFYQIGNAKTGDKVSYFVDSFGNVSFGTISRGSEKTDAGIKMTAPKLLSGIVEQNPSGGYYFIPDNKKIEKNPYIVVNPNSSYLKNYKGKIIIAEVNNFVGGEDTVKVVDEYGKVGDPLPEINAKALEAGVVFQAGERGIKELSLVPTELDISLYNLVDEEGKYITAKDENKFDYVDLRKKMFTTIDPFDCRDMDDAVYTELDEEGNFVTYAAIADVTEYVKPGMELWDNAMQQGFTLYTPSGSFPMLPEKLSSGICSLNPNADRLTMCVKTVIDRKTGKRIDEKSKVMHAVINSKRKFSYNEVQNMLDNLDLNKEYSKITSRIKKGENVVANNLEEQIILNKVCSDCIWKNFNSRNVLKFNANEEIQFTLNKENTNVVNIEEKVHLPSMELIEAMMINANEAVAEFTKNNKINSLYRVHAEPEDLKIVRLYELLSILNVNYDGGASNSSMQKVIDSVKGTPVEEAVNDFVLRTQSKAKYNFKPYVVDDEYHDVSEERMCHNALQSTSYTHFTSGIRRVNDLIVQYAIKNYLRNGKQAFSEDYVAEAGPFISSRELAIEEAERKIDNMCVAIWAENNINQIFSGKVRSIIGNNIQVETDKKLKVEMPISDFVKGEYSVSENGIAVYVKGGEIALKLGDKATFKICAADRISGTVYARNDLNKTYTNPFVYNKDNPRITKDYEERNEIVFGNSNKLLKEIKNYEANKEQERKVQKQKELEKKQNIKNKKNSMANVYATKLEKESEIQLKKIEEMQNNKR